MLIHHAAPPGGSAGVPSMAKRTATKGMRGAVSGGGRAVRAGQPEYELHLRGGINTTDDRIEAELRSPALDPAMHPKGAVHVNVNTDVTTKPKTSAVLDEGVELGHPDLNLWPV